MCEQKDEVANVYDFNDYTNCIRSLMTSCVHDIEIEDEKMAAEIVIQLDELNAEKMPPRFI